MNPIQLKTKRYFTCLACGIGEMYVEHLMDRNGTFGPWYCSNCGQAHRGKVENGICHVELGKRKKEETSVLLKMSPDAGDIFLIVKGSYFDDLNDGRPRPCHPFSDDKDRYFYNEHTCPTNYLQSAIEIITIRNGEADADPHGIFQYVMTAPPFDDEELHIAGPDCLPERLRHFGLQVDGEIPSPVYKWWVIPSGGGEAWPFNDKELAQKAYQQASENDPGATLCRVVKGPVLSQKEKD